MVISRGWGIISFLLLLAGWGLGFAITNPSSLGGGVGLIVAAVGCWFFGQWINVAKPRKDLHTAMDQRAAQLHAAAENGTFYLGPGNPMPNSRADAHAQADALLTAERDQLDISGRNAHTLFWIPVQYFAFIGAAIGVMLIFSAMAGR